MAQKKILRKRKIIWAKCQGSIPCTWDIDGLIKLREVARDPGCLVNISAKDNGK